MERRQAERRAIASSEPLSFARLRTGGELRVLDASSHGVLAETRERLLPGRRLDVHVVASSGRALVRARVTRAYVCRLQADAIDYRAALVFEQPIDVRPAEYPVPPPTVAPLEAGTSYPSRPRPEEIEFIERLSA
jgi:hypothetical protein